MDLYSDSESVISDFNDKDSLFISVKSEIDEDEFDEIFDDDNSAYYSQSSLNSIPISGMDEDYFYTYELEEKEHLRLANIKKTALTEVLIKRYNLNIIKLINTKQYIRGLDIENADFSPEIGLQDHLRPLHILSNLQVINSKLIDLSSKEKTSFVDSDFKYSLHRNHVDALNLKCRILNHFYAELNMEMQFEMNSESNYKNDATSNAKILRLIDSFSKLLQSYNFDTIGDSKSSMNKRPIKRNSISSNIPARSQPVYTPRQQQKKQPDASSPKASLLSSTKTSKPANKDKDKKKFSLFHSSSSTTGGQSSTGKKQKNQTHGKAPKEPNFPSSSVSFTSASTQTSKDNDEPQKYRYELEEVMGYDQTLDDLLDLVERLTLSSSAAMLRTEHSRSPTSTASISASSTSSSLSSSHKSTCSSAALSENSLQILEGEQVNADLDLENVSAIKSVNDQDINSIKSVSSQYTTKEEIDKESGADYEIDNRNRIVDISEIFNENEDEKKEDLGIDRKKKDVVKENEVEAIIQTGSSTTETVKDENHSKKENKSEIEAGNDTSDSLTLFQATTSINASTSSEATMQAIVAAGGIDKAVLTFINKSLLPFIMVDYQRFLEEYLAEVDKLIANVFI
ncbi:hypothetical protein CANARDRAFT_5766 [[Candida] arabinofermentans NRRL YB-2248]|uniref:Uncharacterized protein n=1 Tax=[Candida] arabinofermentans NRRL YB-2248 TaxID=983967 RepID=A0A1E4T634_9ASCO|nr:hypothetical protein CANARDRAFT_5766 [[Candida] arabinofermentans NRRL YB-2248]